MAGPDSDTYLTLSQYLALPEDRLWRTELSRGRLIREPGPGYSHGTVQTQLSTALNLHARRTGAGDVLSGSAYILDVEPGTVRIPDISFVTRERAPRGYSASLPRLAPDLVAEILSPSNRAGDMVELMRDYFDAGVRMIWVIDPRRRTAVVYRPDAAVRLLGPEDALDGEDVLPGLRVTLAELFAD